jgi:hypothetical protein
MRGRSSSFTEAASFPDGSDCAYSKIRFVAESEGK